MDARERIKQLMDQRGWTIYRLSKESGLAQTTISNIFKRNNDPSLQSVEAICRAFGISMSQFFTDADSGSLTSEQQSLLEHWESLAPKQRELLSELIKTML